MRTTAPLVTFVRYCYYYYYYYYMYYYYYYYYYHYHYYYYYYSDGRSRAQWYIRQCCVCQSQFPEYESGLLFWPGT